MSKFFLVISLFVIFCPTISSGEIFHNGSYTVDVSLHNSAMYPIADSSIRVRFHTKEISVDCEATGYTSRRIEIPLPNHQNYFKLNVMLKDMQKDFYPLDINGNELRSVYFQTTQIGCPSNKYLLTVCVPKKILSQPDLSKIMVTDGSLFLSIHFEGSIEEVEDYYFVKLKMKREALEYTGSSFFIIFANATMSEEGHKFWLSRLSEVEKLRGSRKLISQGQDSELTEKLLFQMDPKIIEKFSDDKIPTTIHEFLAQNEKFEKLHSNSLKN
ncbi:MAG: hypothetical protein HQM08_17200 [Candidatus Riflebacteria bacterium]|nr:hypothetical protein [Candidatus Riflebacteria bacterium]